MLLYDSAPTIQGISFVDNTAMADGGGMSLDSASSAIIANASFYGNSAGEGGGLLWSP